MSQITHVSLTKKTIKFFRPVILVMMRSWWFITRPKTKGVKVMILCGNEILLIKNTYGYNYILPGGGIHKGELPEDAARREVSEEVGIQLTNITALPPFIAYQEYKEDTVHSFHGEVASKDFILDKVEIDIAEWFPLDKLPKIGSVSDRIIKTYQTQNI
ncbi:MAG: NUDIX hydrolase [Candidatus Paceibacterota bacterium]